MAVLKGKVERDKAPYTAKCETALTLHSVIPPATQAQKSAKLIQVCRVNYQANPVRTEEFKQCSVLKGQLSPYSSMPAVDITGGLDRVPWSKCHPSHLLQDPALNMGYAQDCILHKIAYSISFCICLEMLKSSAKDLISVTKALHFSFLLPLSPLEAACPKFLCSFRFQEGVNVCKGSLETGQSSRVVKLCCSDMKRQKAKLHWQGKCQQNNKLNADSVSIPLLISVPAGTLLQCPCSIWFSCREIGQYPVFKITSVLIYSGFDVYCTI